MELKLRNLSDDSLMLKSGELKDLVSVNSITIASGFLKETEAKTIVTTVTYSADKMPLFNRTMTETFDKMITLLLMESIKVMTIPKMGTILNVLVVETNDAEY